MIIVRIKGGLGNQLFQYALGRHLALLNNTELKLDVFSYSINSNRSYQLNNLNINEKLATREEILDLTSSLFVHGYTRNNIGSKILRRFVGLQKIKTGKHYVSERKLFYYDEEILKLRGEFYLNGYWQNPNYFKMIRGILLDEFQIIKNNINEENDIIESINNSQSIGLHIRRGDYITNRNNRNIYYELPLDYYTQAIKYLKTKVHFPVIYVFSDDIEWCNKNIKLDLPTKFINSGERGSHFDLYLLSRCKHQIIANSTFSWWAGWLNTYPDKIVISPQRWFYAKKNSVYDLIPEGWYII